MARARIDISLSDSVERALDAPWALLRHDSHGGDVVRLQAGDNIEDAGRSEDRVRHDYAGRYPLELLQNAHDACADAGHNGAVRFAVTETALIVANEGVPFTPDRIRSLIRLGSSEKVRDRGKRHTIGYKGIGFTAVFEITDCPQIISSTVAFGFDRLRARRAVQRILGIKPSDVPARGFPFRLDERAWAEDYKIIEEFQHSGAVTVVRLPLRANRSAEEVAERLVQTIRPEVLLFMPHVREIDLWLPDRRDRWSRTPGAQIGAGRLMHLRERGGQKRSWLVSAASARAPRQAIEELEDPLWTNVKHLNVSAALPWRNGADPERGDQNLHVYFPTDDALGRALLIHGDFYVDSGRRHIEFEGPGGEISRSVATAAAKLAARLVESVANRGGRQLLECLAQRGPTSGFGETIGGLIETELKNSRIVRPADGSRPRRPHELVRLALDAARREQKLLKLLSRTRDILRPGDDRGIAGKLLERLGTPVLSGREVAQRIDPPKAGANYEAALRTLALWLGTFDQWDASEICAELRERRIVKDSRGRWRRPRDVVIHRPDSPNLPPKLRMTEFVAPSGTAIRGLIRALDIPELSAATALEIVIGAVRRRAFGKEAREAEQVHAFVRSAWRQARRDVEARRGKLGCIPVPVRTARGRRTSWRRADQVYFSKEWAGAATLEVLYGRLGQTEFLAQPLPRNNAGRRAELALYETLGVASEPRILRHEGTSSEYYWRQRLAQYGQWRKQGEVQAALKCPDGHTQTARHISVVVLDRLDDLLAANNQEVSAALARYLSGIKNPLLRDAEVYCMNTAHYGGARRKRAIGYQRWRLMTTPWIPVRNDPAGANMRPPTEAWFGNRLPPWLIVPQARLKPETVRGLHLVSVERPGVTAVERALKDLSQSFPDLAEAPEDVRKSADWLLKRLDRANQRRDVDATEPPPLPCRAKGRLIWSSSPMIGDVPGLDDLSGLEVLPAGDWRGLRRAYALRQASDALTRELEVGDRIQAPKLLSREKQARLAAVLAGQGGDEDRVAVRLARLREFTVEYIQVRLAYKGHTDLQPVPRPFYLDVQQDRAGRVVGARLFVTPPVEPRTRITIGRDLAGYLDAPDLHASIALFLTNADAVIESEKISEEDIAEASRRVESHRRKRNVIETEDAGLLDSGENLPLDESEVETEGGSGSSASGEAKHGTGPAQVVQSEKPAPPLPPLDHDGISVTDVTPGSAIVMPPPSEPRGSTGTSATSGQTVDWAELERIRRLYGRRGEEAAYENERRRLIELGWDPALVKWVARDNELAPYDIESLNDDGTARYIEVKSTTDNDPSEPFQISSAELRFAIEHRSQYFLYRVTDVREATPRIHRYRDPIGELEARRGYLRTSKALMALAPADAATKGDLE